MTIKQIKTTSVWSSPFHPNNRKALNKGIFQGAQDCCFIGVTGVPSGGNCTASFMGILITIESIAIVYPLVYYKKMLADYDDKVGLKVFLGILIFLAIALMFQLVINPVLFKIFIEIPYRVKTTRILEDDQEKFSIGAALNLTFNPFYEFKVLSK